MRLIHTTTLKPHDFFAEDVPPYAILSHRWDIAEVTYQDLSEGRGHRMKGWAKVAGCCAKASFDGWEYIWIDSCCIDKASSAELSEAINSMFKWYQNAQVCYAYLSDVSLTRQNPYDATSEFRSSKWFTRGWTLQELLAPRYLEFHDRNWVEIGTKFSLRKLLSTITGVSVDFLFDFRSASVAQKMCWAANRVTKRVEDEAYCLMGLFGVNMPPLYGEGGNAFLRLQLEILNQTDDESIFAWEPLQDRKQQVSKLLALGSNSLLAPHARCFRNAARIVAGISYHPREPVRMSSKGLSVQFRVYSKPDNCYLMPLNCVSLKGSDSSVMSVSGETDTERVVLSIDQNLPAIGTFRRRDKLIITPDSQLTNSRIVQYPFMYFPQDRILHEYAVPQSNLLSTRFLIDYRSMIHGGFTLDYKYIQSLDATDLSPVQAERGAYWDSTIAVKAKAHRSILQTFSGPEHGALLAFRKTGCKRCCLVILKTATYTTIDLVHPAPDETPSEAFASVRNRLLGEASLGIRFARLSLKTTERSFVSASLKQAREESSGNPMLKVELSVDNFERWPAPFSPSENES